MDERKTLNELDRLVNGDDRKWQHNYNDTEFCFAPRRRAWFRRCCGQRMRTIWRLVRYKDQDQYPANSRRARMWWGAKWGWKCENCGLEEKDNS